jgi:4-hydroxyphenylpyruvate dioxygenase
MRRSSSMDVLQWARHHRSFPGQGDFDVTGFFEQVLRAGYTGPLSLEIFNDIFRETPNRRTAVDAMRSLLYLESEARRRMAAAEPRAAAARGAVQPAAGARAVGPVVHRVRGRRGLGPRACTRWCRQLGFRRIGTHRSKAVTLYRQGEINLIVNAQPDSFARQRFDAHGTSVCALGVRCDDPLAAVGRATAMRSQRHDSPVGPNELRVPAIVAPGGNLIHFVPEALGANGLYEADFVLDDAGARQRTTPACSASTTWPWAWRSTSSTPGCCSRAPCSAWSPARAWSWPTPSASSAAAAWPMPQRSLRLVLNVSLSQRTRTARTLSVTGGGAVHHIALGCADIFDTVARLRANGTRFVPISDNYHDDLATRIDLAPALLARMREAGVLFDRSPGGDYLHIYTESFEGGLFFEVAQRVGSYDAYGALNAPARMASQAQD